MHGISHFLSSVAITALCLLCLAPCSAETTIRISSRFLARGEQAALEVAITGDLPAAVPVIPALEGVEIRRPGRDKPRRELLTGRKMAAVYDFVVSSYVTGRHVIPALEVMIGGVKTQTEPLEFTVFNPDELLWSEATTDTSKIRYATAFRVMNPRPYDGQTIPVEIKLFVPRDLVVEDWGIPNFERDGLTSWRFQPSLVRGSINLLGMPYVAVAYPSTLTPTRTGKVTIGPATIRLMTTQVVMDGILKRISQEVNLTVPKLELESLPLPDGAPQGFENAVGNFQLDVTSDSTEVQEGDPLAVDICVRGTGNLDTLHPPQLADSNGWKLYDATTEARGDERREFSGQTIFHQFLRPLELKPAIPPFRLVFFDPNDATYKTLTSEPIPLQMTPATPITPAATPDTPTPPEALPVPVERMTDILGVLRSPSLVKSSAPRLPNWSGHALAGLLALALMAKTLWMRVGPRLRRNDAARNARLLELREITCVKPDDHKKFLLLAGSFIERSFGENPTSEMQAVLAQRDSLCFQKTTPIGTVLTQKRRNHIVKLLKKATLTCLLVSLLALCSSSLRAADLSVQALDAYDAAQFDEAARLWLLSGAYQDLPADTLYNIGNASYRAGSPGYAALYYRRALTRDPNHQESRQNLRFIERKWGAITIQRPDYQYAITRFPLSCWKGLIWSGVWLCALSLLVFPATRPGAPMRVLAVAVAVAANLLATLGALGCWYFPNDAEFAAPERQAVIIAAKATLHTDAAGTSPEVIDAPPGSLCEIIQESGCWAYVAFTTKIRGWIPMDAIDKVVPVTAPVAPTIGKPKVDDNSTSCLKFRENG